MTGKEGRSLQPTNKGQACRSASGSGSTRRFGDILQAGGRAACLRSPSPDDDDDDDGPPPTLEVIWAASILPCVSLSSSAILSF